MGTMIKKKPFSVHCFSTSCHTHPLSLGICLGPKNDMTSIGDVTPTHLENESSEGLRLCLNLYSTVDSHIRREACCFDSFFVNV